MNRVIDITTRSGVAQAGGAVRSSTIAPVMEHLTILEGQLSTLRWMAFCQRELCRTFLAEVPEAKINMAEGQALEGLLTLANQIEEMALGADAQFQALHEVVVRPGGRA